MTKREIVEKIEALNEWEALMEEARTEAEAIKDSLKAEMIERETEELIADLTSSDGHQFYQTDLTLLDLKEYMENYIKHLQSSVLAEDLQFLVN